MPLPSKSFSSSGLLITAEMPTTAEGARSMALRLAQERRHVDEEIQSNLSVLQEQEATMTSPLIDSQGFPLATTDIVAVRTARSRIIALKNDREALENKMRDLLEIELAKNDDVQVTATSLASSAAAGSASTNHPSDTPTSTASASTGQAWGRLNGRNDGLSMMVDTVEGTMRDWTQVGGMQAFAKINTVAEASPAQRADLRIGDEVLTFGELDAVTAHRNVARKDLANLPSAVQEGKEVSLVILRQGQNGQKAIKRLQLTPASGWGGRGLLGCHIVPM